jgi:hypothetical protein
MKLFDLVEIADKAYCPEDSGLLLQYLDKSGKLISHEKAAKVDRPDTLALFIVREISDVAAGEKNPRRQRQAVAVAMESAYQEISRVRSAFSNL